MKPPVAACGPLFWFIKRLFRHGVRNDTDQPAVTLVIYAGAGTLEEAGYEEHPRQFDKA